MANYRKKPVVIEAIQWTGDNEMDILDFTRGTSKLMFHGYSGGPALTIKTLEGEMRADRGDYIIKGVRGEFYPCKPDIFAATYEDASAPDEIAAPVVRCRDCVYRGGYDCPMEYAIQWGIGNTSPGDDDFCSEGQRMDADAPERERMGGNEPLARNA